LELHPAAAQVEIVHIIYAQPLIGSCAMIHLKPWISFATGTFIRMVGRSGGSGIKNARLADCPPSQMKKTRFGLGMTTSQGSMLHAES
jgi:hypothetical protein